MMINLPKQSPDDWRLMGKSCPMYPRTASIATLKAHMVDGWSITEAKYGEGDEERSREPNHGKTESSSTKDPPQLTPDCISDMPREISLSPGKQGKEFCLPLKTASSALPSLSRFSYQQPGMYRERAGALKITILNGKA